MTDHKQFDIFGKKCAPVVGLNDCGCPMIQMEDPTSTRNAATKLAPVLQKYTESTDGSFNILIQVEWQTSPNDKKEIYLLKMDPEYMYQLFSMMEQEMKEGQWKFKVIVASDVKEDDIVYDQVEFLNLLCHNYFGFECIRPGRKVHQRIGTSFSKDSVLTPSFSQNSSCQYNQLSISDTFIYTLCSIMKLVEDFSIPCH